MTASHYLFGDFIDAELTPERLIHLFDRARTLSLQTVSIREILDILDRVGRRWRDPDWPLRIQARNELPDLIGFSPEMIDRGFSELGRLLDRTELENKLRFDLGRSATLDGWVWEKNYEGYLRAAPLGVLTHVSPGNVFLGAADSLVHGILTKNINIVKVSKGDPLFPLLFARSIREADPEGRICRSFAVMTLPEERAEQEEILRTRSDGIVIWGGSEAVAAWSQGVAHGVKVIPYGPRTSFALVTELALDELGWDALPVDGLVQDVISWETRACGSPQMLFWPESRRNELPDFMDHVGAKFQEWTAEIPPMQLDIGEAVEVRRELELTKFLAMKGRGRVLADPGLRWSVQVREWADHHVSPLNRTLVIICYPNTATLLEWIRPLRSQLQSVGLAATSAEYRHLGLALTDAGVTRITEWGKMWLPKHGSPHDGTYQMRELIRWATIESLPLRFDVEKRLQPIPPSKTEKLERLIEVARERSRYYASVLPKVKLLGANDLSQFPRLDAETLRKNTPPAGDALLTGPLDGAYIFSSGGSTGAPKFSFYTLDEWEDVTDILSAIYQKAGVTKGDTVANLFMAGSLWTSFLAASEALEKLGCSKLPIAGNVEPDTMIGYLEMFKPTVLLGLPSLLIRLAEELERQGKRLQARTVLYGGESLSREARQYLQRILGATTVASAGYASVDAGPIGYQTLDLKVGEHRLLYDHQFLEFLDPETGEPVADGEVGEITVTSLRRRLMPLIRYRTGDLGRWTDSRTWIFELKGRIGDRIRVGTADIYPSDVARILDTVQGAGHVFQMNISKRNRKDFLELCVERPAGNEHSVEASTVREALLDGLPELKQAEVERWLDGFEVQITEQGSLLGMTRTGKIKSVVDHREK